MKGFIKLLCICAFVSSSHAFLRHRRSGGRVEISSQIRAPSRLRQGEPRAPPPGWTHCVLPITAASSWRTISTISLSDVKTTQFQCTWIISTELPNWKVQISIQRLTLGNTDDTRCQQQFMEIIDSGKTQGRFCDNQKPGDYVTLGNRVRLDIQGEGTLAQLVRSRRNPFRINYKAVQPDVEPGFRTYTSSPARNEFDRYHTITNGARIPLRPSRPPGGGGIRNTPARNNNDEETEEGARFGALSLAGLIAVVVCSVLVVLIIILLLARWFCCASPKEKSEGDKPRYETVEEANVYPPLPYTNVYVLPGKAHTPHINSEKALPPDEVILKSEIVRPQKTKKSISDSPKKASQMSILQPTKLIEKKPTPTKMSSNDSMGSNKNVDEEKSHLHKQKVNKKSDKLKQSANLRKTSNEVAKGSTKTKEKAKTQKETNNNEIHPKQRSRSAKKRNKNRSGEEEDIPRRCRAKTRERSSKKKETLKSSARRHKEKKSHSHSKVISTKSHSAKRHRLKTQKTADRSGSVSRPRTRS